jgi:hypothetical protein
MDRRIMTTNVRAHEPSINELQYLPSDGSHRELRDDELDGVTGGLSDAFRGRYQLRLEESTKLL